jgi:hypothetical protein
MKMLHLFCHGFAVFVAAASIFAQSNEPAPPSGKDLGEGKEVISEPTSALAPEDAWQFAITPYFWLPSVDFNLFLPTVNTSNRSFGGDLSTSIPWWEGLKF